MMLSLKSQSLGNLTLLTTQCIISELLEYSAATAYQKTMAARFLKQIAFNESAA